MYLAVTTATWVWIAPIAWALIILIFLVLFLSSKRRKARRKDRPEYECGNSISDWERACAKSLAWSQQRRSG